MYYVINGTMPRSPWGTSYEIAAITHEIEMMTIRAAILLRAIENEGKKEAISKMLRICNLQAHVIF